MTKRKITIPATPAAELIADMLASTPEVAVLDVPTTDATYQETPETVTVNIPGLEPIELTKDVPEPQEGTPEVSEPSEDSTPEPEPAPIAIVVGSKDPLGFGTSTVTSAIIAAIRSGEFTRKEMVEAILSEFAGTDAAKIKATKTTISVTWSDLQRPVLKYHASRSLVIVENPKTHKVSFDQARYDVVIAAIADGLLSNLRGKSTSKREEILKAAGLPIR